MAVDICDAEIQLRERIALFGGAMKPFHCFRVALRNSLAFGIRKTEVKLRVRISRLSAPLEGFNPLRIVRFPCAGADFARIFGRIESIPAGPLLSRPVT